MYQKRSGKLLPLMECYYTIQGEGRNTGMPAVFIRLGGCDAGCHWCDVKESWDSGKYPAVEVEEIIARASMFPCRNAVITGGEPTMYNLGPLTAALKKQKNKTFIETSGAYRLTGEWDWVSLSPKKTMPPDAGVHSHADELKVVIYNRDDFRWAEKHAAKVSKKCSLYLQPEWSVRIKMMPITVEFVKQNPQWRISLQTHKYINIP